MTCPEAILANLDLTPHLFRCLYAHIGYHCLKEGELCSNRGNFDVQRNSWLGVNGEQLKRNDTDQL